MLGPEKDKAKSYVFSLVVNEEKDIKTSYNLTILLPVYKVFSHISVTTKARKLYARIAWSKPRI